MSTRTAELVQTLSKESEALSKDIDSFSDRAFELQRLAKALVERSGRDYVDKAVQADSTSVGAPAYTLDRAKRLAPFSFTPCDRKMNWRKLRAFNIDRVVREGDTRSLLEMYGELAYVDLEKESVYEMTEANMLKLVRALQLMLQYQQYQVDEHRHVQQLMAEERMHMVGTLRMVPGLEVNTLEKGLDNLKEDFLQVADADLDAMFTQVRTEERTDARDTVGVKVDQVKRALDINTIGGGGGAPAASASGVPGGPQGPGSSVGASVAFPPPRSTISLTSRRGQPGGDNALGSSIKLSDMASSGRLGSSGRGSGLSVRVREANG